MTKLTEAERRAIEYLRRGPQTAGMVGTAVWGDSRRGRVVSASGGGDYAAQMLLGRLRKKGLVETTMAEGASQWRLTAKGYKTQGAVA